MRALTKEEILCTNGGGKAPSVSHDSSVQGGYTVGWHIGHAIGNTINDFGKIWTEVKGWFIE